MNVVEHQEDDLSVSVKIFLSFEVVVVDFECLLLDGVFVVL